MGTEPIMELMELVLRQTGGQYLSDLHEAGNAAEVRRAVLEIPVQNHSVEAWTALTNYITRREQAFDNGEQAVSALLMHLQKQIEKQADEAKE